MSDPVILSVLIPVYNEAKTIVACIERVEAVPLDMELIIIDDGSSDGTSEILRRLASDRDPARFRLMRQPFNRGKGAGLRRAIPLARGRVTVVQDADLEYDPRDFPMLVAPILDGVCDVVYGSRRIHDGNRYPIDRYLMGSWFLTILTNLLFGSRLTDVPTCYKAYRTATLQSLELRCDGFEFCTEATAKTLKRGEQILEVPIRYTKRSVAEGKKVTWHDGLMGTLTLLKYRFFD
ncbi:glycosyltransferase family 2 protein [Myxococcota bacterium]